MLNKTLLICTLTVIGTVSSVFSQLPGYLPEDGLVAWWPFCGNAHDESGNLYHGVVDGAQLTTDRYGYLSSAYYFDGVDDQIVIDNLCADMPEDAISISVWVKSHHAKTQSLFQLANNSQTNRVLVHMHWQNPKNTYWDYGNIFDNGRLHCDVDSSKLNVWEHYVFVAETSSNKLEIYMNGNLVCSKYNAKATFMQTITDFWIGGGAVPGNIAFFSGIIDDFGIWNRVLSQSEIIGLYNAEPYFPCYPLVDLDEDNSSGDSTINWIETSYCDETTWPICDEDVFITLQYGIDSIHVKLNNTPTPSEDSFQFTTVDSISILVHDNHYLTLVPDLGNPSKLTWENALKNIQLHHSSGILPSGDRLVTVDLWRNNIKSETAYAIIMSNYQKSSVMIDTTIILCKTEDLYNLGQLIGRTDLSSVDWTPPTVYGSAEYHPLYDGEGTWQYITTHDSIECNTDTFQVTIKLIPTPIIDVEPIYFMCPGDSILIQLEDTLQVYTWNGIEGPAHFLIKNQGVYTIEVENQFGCKSEKIITVEQPEIYTTIKHIVLCHPDEYVYNGDTIAETGTYEYQYITEKGCDSLVVLHIESIKKPIVSVLGNIFSCGQDSTLITLEGINNVVWNNGAVGNTVSLLDQGTYYYSYSDNQGCAWSDSIEIQNYPGISADWHYQDPSCHDYSDGNIVISNIQGGTAPLMLNGNIINPSSEFVLSDLTSGEYTISIIDSVGCGWYKEFNLANPPEYYVTMPTELTIKEGIGTSINFLTNLNLPILINPTPQEDITYNGLNSLFFFPNKNTTYTIIFMDENGCDVHKSIQIYVIPDYKIYTPNTFSPNYDGINDRWVPFIGEGKIIDAVILRIYNRWGGLLYEEKNASDKVGWDGMFKEKLCDPGIYVFTLEVMHESSLFLLLKGDINLVR